MSLGKRLMSYAALVLGAVVLWSHGGHFFQHLVEAMRAMAHGDIANAPDELKELAPALVFGIASHMFDLYHHVISTVAHAHADVLAVLAQYGAAKILLGIGLGVLWFGVAALAGIVWWPMVSACVTWSGKICWTAVYVGLIGFCLELTDRFRKWTPAGRAH